MGGLLARELARDPGGRVRGGQGGDRLGVGAHREGPGRDPDLVDPERVGPRLAGRLAVGRGRGERRWPTAPPRHDGWRGARRASDARRRGRRMRSRSGSSAFPTRCTRRAANDGQEDRARARHEPRESGFTASADATLRSRSPTTPETGDGTEGRSRRSRRRPATPPIRSARSAIASTSRWRPTGRRPIYLAGQSLGLQPRTARSRDRDRARRLGAPRRRCLVRRRRALVHPRRDPARVDGPHRRRAAGRGRACSTA